MGHANPFLIFIAFNQLIYTVVPAVSTLIFMFYVHFKFMYKKQVKWTNYIMF